jgi:hypothetical protein
MESRFHPFGLLFEEQPLSVSITVVTYYDPLEQISFVVEDNSISIPFVLSNLSNTSTLTATAVKKEEPDPDLPTSNPEA